MADMEKVKGTVLKSTGNEYTVRTTDGRQVMCKLRGQFRLRGINSTNPIAVGDHVLFLPDSGLFDKVYG